jgi:hypothetical protein
VRLLEQHEHGGGPDLALVVVVGEWALGFGGDALEVVQQPVQPGGDIAPPLLIEDHGRAGQACVGAVEAPRAGGAQPALQPSVQDADST